MNAISKNAALDTLGLPSGNHWVRFHVEGDEMSFEVAVSVPASTENRQQHGPTGFVAKWGGSITKEIDAQDTWLTHLNNRHLR
jgi:hypothetical protein